MEREYILKNGQKVKGKADEAKIFKRITTAFRKFNKTTNRIQKPTNYDAAWK